VTFPGKEAKSGDNNGSSLMEYRKNGGWHIEDGEYSETLELPWLPAVRGVSGGDASLESAPILGGMMQPGYPEL